jgi:predicted transcriptional regulator
MTNVDIMKQLVEIFKNENMLENKKAYKDFKSNKDLDSLNLSSQKVVSLIGKLVNIGIVEKTPNGKTTLYQLTNNYTDLLELIK